MRVDPVRLEKEEREFAPLTLSLEAPIEKTVAVAEVRGLYPVIAHLGLVLFYFP